MSDNKVKIALFDNAVNVTSVTNCHKNFVTVKTLGHNDSCETVTVSQVSQRVCTRQSSELSPCHNFDRDIINDYILPYTNMSDPHSIPLGASLGGGYKPVAIATCSKSKPDDAQTVTQKHCDTCDKCDNSLKPLRPNGLSVTSDAVTLCDTCDTLADSFEDVGVDALDMSETATYKIVAIEKADFVFGFPDLNLYEKTMEF